MNKIAIGALAILVVSSLIYALIDNVDQVDKDALTASEILQDCMPKSDMASRQKCQEAFDTIDSFEKCQEAGLPVMESYPSRCQTPDGKSFTQIVEEDNANRGDQVQVAGEVGCLVSQADGPQTLECRYGIFTDKGLSYALDMSELGVEKMMEIKDGDRWEVEGRITPLEQISTNMWDKYGIEGIISVMTADIIKGE